MLTLFATQNGTIVMVSRKLHCCIVVNTGHAHLNFIWFKLAFITLCHICQLPHPPNDRLHTASLQLGHKWLCLHSVFIITTSHILYTAMRLSNGGWLLRHLPSLIACLEVLEL